MRDYLFRGKRKDNGQWVEGCYHHCTGSGLMRFVEYKDGNRVVEDRPLTLNKHWILVHQTPDSPGWSIGDTFFAREVLPETVGAYIDRNDKTGKRIFNGDILEIKDKYKEGITLVRWNRIKCKYEGTCISPNGNWIENGIYCDADSFSMYTKIGNLWDNPGLVNPAVKDSVTE